MNSTRTNVTKTHLFIYILCIIYECIHIILLPIFTIKEFQENQCSLGLDDNKKTFYSGVLVILINIFFIVTYFMFLIWYHQYIFYDYDNTKMKELCVYAFGISIICDIFPFAFNCHSRYTIHTLLYLLILIPFHIVYGIIAIVILILLGFCVHDGILYLKSICTIPDSYTPLEEGSQQ